MLTAAAVLLSTVSWGPRHTAVVTAHTEIFVSSMGDDANSGTSPTAPVATISRAAELVRNRELRSAPATVTVAPGVYAQPQMIKLGEQDGGDGESSRVTWRGSGPGATVLSFGAHIPVGATWKAVGHGLFQHQLVPPEGTFAAARPRQLWEVSDAHTNRRMTRARSPNAGDNYIIPLGGTTANGFRYRQGDLNPDGGLVAASENLSDVEVVVYASWCTSRHHIHELNTTGELSVTLTGSSIRDMWPNSGNRYYLENSVKFVDSPTEWHISDSGLLTLHPPGGLVDPSASEWMLDQGDGLKTGLQLKDDTIGALQLLVPKLVGGAPAVVLPADRMNLAAANWVLSIDVLQMPAGESGLVLTRGPAPFRHVPGDTTFTVQTDGNLMMDFGWSFTLIGKMKVNDGKPHRVQVSYAEPVITLCVDGTVDATMSHPSGVQDGAGWKVTVASPPHGALLRGLSFATSQSRAVRYLTFENLHIAHVGWGTFGNMQSASFLDSAAVHLHNASNVNFMNFSVAHVGGYGIWIEGGSSDILLDSTKVADCSGGIRVGRGNPLSAEPLRLRTHDVVINNSRLTGGALVYREAAGVIVQNADAVSLLRSEVSHFNHVAVSFGWVWGFSPRAGRDNRIEFNHIHHVGNHDLSDLGGIYMLGVQPNSTVRGNIVHDSHPFFMYGHGIYLDEGASGIHVTQNWVHDTFAASWMQHYGLNNTIDSNVFAKATGHCLTFTPTGSTDNGTQPPDVTYCPGYIWHPAYRGQRCGYAIERNIFLAHPNSTGGADAHHWHEPAEGICNVTSAKNLFWNSSGGKLSPTFPSTHKPTCPSYACNLASLESDASLQNWQLRGHETNSMVADPGFVDASKNNYNLKESDGGGPAVRLGFVPLDLTKGVGPDW